MKRLAQFVFFLSGFAALVYQVIWQRLLMFFGGADVYSVTIIVSAFMAGLGFGSVAGGHFADRLSPRARLLGFAMAELAICVFAVSSAAVFYDLLYVRLGPLGLSRPMLAVILFVVLLWPTFFMGMSLPLLARALADNEETSARWVSGLYGWNTLGAACGSLVAVWILFRAMDLRAATWTGAILSGVCALAGACFARWTPAAAGSPATRSGVIGPIEPSPDTQPVMFRLITWMAIYAMSGYVALSLEILWLRILGVMIKSNSFTFGTLLAIYLGGVGAGALLADRARLERLSAARMFFLLQSAIPLYAALALTAFIFGLGRTGTLEPLWQYMSSLLPPDDPLAALRQNFAVTLAVWILVPVFLIGPPTVMMGMSFSYLQRAVQTDLDALGRRVGWLQASNITGSMLGALMTGLVMLEWVGSLGTLRLLLILGGGFLLVALADGRVRRGAGVPYVGCLAVLMFAGANIPSSDRLWASVHGADSRSVIVGEDRSGLSLFKLRPFGRETVVFVNGVAQSTLPYGGIHTALGALPALIHPGPATIAVIGLGSADTLFSAGGRPETSTIDSIEIIAAQLDTLRQLDRLGQYPGLRTVLRDGRIRHHFTDGRAFVMRQPRKYDIVEADALRPTSSFSGNLYSFEYFGLLRERLKPGGLAVTWCPTERVRNTFVKAFPYVMTFGSIGIASNQPIPYRADEVRVRARMPFTHDYYADGGVDVETLLDQYLTPPVVFGPEFDRAALSDINHDLYPKDEFMIPPSAR
jgi:predicted membrane-bound spermidine synthase